MNEVPGPWWAQASLPAVAEESPLAAQDVDQVSTNDEKGRLALCKQSCSSRTALPPPAAAAEEGPVNFGDRVTKEAAIIHCTLGGIPLAHVDRRPISGRFSLPPAPAGPHWTPWLVDPGEDGDAAWESPKHFQLLLKELVDGQRRLEKQVGEVRHDVRQLSASLLSWKNPRRSDQSPSASDDMDTRKSALKLSRSFSTLSSQSASPSELVKNVHEVNFEVDKGQHDRTSNRTSTSSAASISSIPVDDLALTHCQSAPRAHSLRRATTTKSPMCQRLRLAIFSDPTASKSSASWPACVPLRDGLSAGALRTALQSGDGRQAFKAMRTCVLNHESGELADNQTLQYAGRCMRRIVLDPASTRILFYDVLSSLVLLHDFVVIPFMIAWEVPYEGWFKISAFISCFFWMNDIGMSFITGYLKDGQVELGLGKIARHYMTRWFCFDISLVLLDTICVFGNALLSIKVTRIFRIFRFIRLISFVRAFRITAKLENVLDRGASQWSWSVSYVLKVFVMIFWLSHMISCMWYWIGCHANSGGGPRWFDTVGTDFDRDPQEYQYFTSFHWALSQISASGVEMISPMNTTERIFNIGCLAFGVVFGSALVSSLSATMIEVQMSKQEKLVKIRTVRQFLRQHEIPKKLGFRVRKQLADRLKKKKNLPMKDIPEFLLLSYKLRVELQFAIIGHHLLKHPLFALSSDIDMHAVQCWSYEVVEVVFAPLGEVIFAYGSDANSAYYTTRGEFKYTQSPMSAAHIRETLVSDVDVGVWLSMTALWSCWKHVGTFEASSATEFLVISAQGMLAVMLQHPLIGMIAREYGYQFHNRLTKAMPPQSEWPSDLDVPFTSFAELVLAMSKQARIIVSMSALSKLRNERAWLLSAQQSKIQSLALLEEEINIGKTTLMVTEAGQVERVVTVATLRLENGDDKLLVQVGKVVDGRMVACCRLPGKHHGDSETPSEAVQRLIDSDFDFWARDIQLDMLHGGEQADETKDSQVYGLRTHYVRTVHTGLLDDPCPSLPEKVRLRRKMTARRSMKLAIAENTGVQPSKSRMSSAARLPFGGGESEKKVFLPTRNSARASVLQTLEAFAADTSIYAWLSEDDYCRCSESPTLAGIQEWLAEHELPIVEPEIIAVASVESQRSQREVKFGVHPTVSFADEPPESIAAVIESV